MQLPYRYVSTLHDGRSKLDTVSGVNVAPCDISTATIAQPLKLVKSLPKWLVMNISESVRLNVHSSHDVPEAGLLFSKRI